MPDSLTNIGDSAFCNCKNLKEITIPNSVTTIGARAFMNCDSLTEIAIPASVTKLGEDAIDNYGFEKIIFLGSAPEGIDNAITPLPMSSLNLEIYYSDDSFDSVINGDINWKEHDVEWIRQ